MRIGIIELAVDDQEQARRFYTDVLGLVIKTDALYGETGRWLTVISPEQPEGPELLLTQGSDAACALQTQRRATGSPAMSFATADCQRDYETLIARGATFLGAPRRREYGGIDAVLEDGCGNLLNLHQAE